MAPKPAAWARWTSDSISGRDPSRYSWNHFGPGCEAAISSSGNPETALVMWQRPKFAAALTRPMSPSGCTRRMPPHGAVITGMASLVPSTSVAVSICSW